MTEQINVYQIDAVKQILNIFMLCKINVVKVIKVVVELKLERIVTINCNIL